MSRPPSATTSPDRFGLSRLKTKRPRALRAAVLILLPLAAAATVNRTVTAVPTTERYPETLLPPFWPPDAIFGAVWAALYAAMALAAWLVWTARGFSRAKIGFALFFAQLGLNALWTPLFFVLRDPALALVELGVLWAAVLGTVVAFWSVRRAAGLLLMPYLAWLTFAAALNGSVVAAVARVGS